MKLKIANLVQLLCLASFAVAAFAAVRIGDAPIELTPGTPKIHGITMTPEDRAAYPHCEPMESWRARKAGVITESRFDLLVIHLNGDREIVTLGDAFDTVHASKTHPKLSIWVIGVCR